MSRDLRSFEIRFEFESDDSDSIRFESDGLIRKFRIGLICRHTTNHADCSTTKKLQPLRRCNWDLFYVYVARAYTLHTSLAGAIVQIVRPTVRTKTRTWSDRYIYTCKRLHPDLIRDSIRTKISDSQVPTHVTIVSFCYIRCHCPLLSATIIIESQGVSTTPPQGPPFLWLHRGGHRPHTYLHISC